MASTPAERDSETQGLGRLIDGKKTAEAVLEALVPRVAKVMAKLGRPPGLAVILVGDDGPSAVYVRNKARAAKKLGLHSRIIALPTETDARTLHQAIGALNEDSTIDAFLVQLPLPKHLDGQSAIALIAPHKDADALGPGAQDAHGASLVPCTPAGCLALIRTECPTVAGLHAVVVGRSAIVGRPMARLLTEENATVTVCHSHTQNLRQHTRMADVLVVAAGVPHLISAQDVKPGAVVIDVGIHRQLRADGRACLVGDVDTASVLPVARAVTPVPGGVGPMTIAMLMCNAVAAAEAAASLSCAPRR